MTIYRINKNLTKGRRLLTPEKDKYTTLNWLNKEGVQKIILTGAVSELSAPPLSELPGWKTRYKKLSQIGIENASDFLEMDKDALMEKSRISEISYQKWKEEIETFLFVSKPKTSG